MRLKSLSHLKKPISSLFEGMGFFLFFRAGRFVTGIYKTGVALKALSLDAVQITIGM